MKKLIFLVGFLAIAATSFSQTVRARTYFNDLFVPGYKPTQTNYRDLFASIFFHNQDTLAVTRLVGVDELSNDPTLADSSARAIPTEAAVKAYIDAVSVGGVTDGDKGDIRVSSSGTVYTVDTGAITSVKILDGTIATGDLAFTPLTTSSTAGGDISGAFSNLQIAANAVGNAEMADNAIGSAEIIAESIQASDIDTAAVTTSEILDGTVGYIDLAQAVKDTIGTYWKKTGRVVTSNSDVHVVVADSASISSANTILSASTNIYLNPTGELVLGNGSGTNLPTTNSGHLGMDLGYDGTGVLVGSQKTAKRNLIGLTDPVSGSTIAFYNGQLYTNSATGDIFVATTASANPDLSGTGSTWVKVSDGGSVTISDTLNDFPAATSITASEKLVMPDSTVTWQKVVNQIRDSTLFGDGISEGTLGRGMLGGTYMLNHVSKFSGTRKINLNTYDLIFGRDTDSTLFRFFNTSGSSKGFYIQPSSGGIDYKYLLGNSVTNWAFNTNSVVAGGALQIGQSGAAPLLMITTGPALGVGTGITSFGLPQRFFHVESPTSKTNSIEYHRYGHITDASATTGFGFGTEIELENASASKKIVATTKYVYTDATAGSEDVDYIVGNIVGGTLADRLYLRGSKLGIGVSSPTSSVDVQTGSATQAPLKFTVTGAALLTTPVMGNVEVLGNKLFYTDSTGVRCEIQKIKKNVTGVGTLTLTTDYSDYIFTGTTSTWTLPSISNGDGVLWRIKNRGSGNITINSASGGNDIYDASAVSTYTVTAGSAIIILNDGTYFNIQ